MTCLQRRFLKTALKVSLMALFPLSIVVCVAPDAQAQDSPLISNLRRGLDFSSRSVYDEHDTWHVAAVGLDLHTVLTGERGDIGTLTMQPYLLRVDNVPNPSSPFADDHDWALQWRVTNFNYTGLGHGKLNIRVGHFELPFGLEQIEQTNGTLYQLNSPANVGLKADWGTSINGVLPQVEYEIAYMLGEGNDLSATDGGLWVGRVGSSSDRRWRFGASFLNGEQQEPNLVQRERYGIDFSYQFGHGLSAACDFSEGRDQKLRVKHQLLQLKWTDTRERVHTYAQWRRSSTETSASNDRQSAMRLGVRYEPSPIWSASVEWQQDLNAAEFQSRGSMLLAQLRLRLQT